MKPTVLCYPACGTCKKAEKWMKDNGVDYTYRPIKEENPTTDELKLWLGISGLPVSKFFNTSGLLYKEQNMKDKIKVLSEAELIDILSQNGLMVKRPLLIAGSAVLVGFKEEQWKELFKIED